MAQDALATALAGYVHERWDIPVPSPPVDGQELTPVPPVTAAKLALFTAMRVQDITNVELAKRASTSAKPRSGSS
jgi:antitoxin HicB